jgi:hypothetical protein
MMAMAAAAAAHRSMGSALNQRSTRVERHVYFYRLFYRAPVYTRLINLYRTHISVYVQEQNYVGQERPRTTEPLGAL